MPIFILFLQFVVLERSSGEWATRIHFVLDTRARCIRWWIVADWMDTGIVTVDSLERASKMFKDWYSFFIIFFNGGLLWILRIWANTYHGSLVAFTFHFHSPNYFYSVLIAMKWKLSIDDGLPISLRFNQLGGDWFLSRLRSSVVIFTFERYLQNCRPIDARLSRSRPICYAQLNVLIYKRSAVIQDTNILLLTKCLYSCCVIVARVWLANSCYVIVWRRWKGWQIQRTNGLKFIFVVSVLFAWGMAVRI